MNYITILHSTHSLFILSTAIVILSDWLLFSHALGINIAILLAVFSILLLIRTRPRHVSRQLLVVFSLYLGLIISLLLHPSLIAVCLALLLLSSIAAANRGGLEQDINRLIKQWLAFALFGWSRIFSDCPILLRQATLLLPNLSTLQEIFKRWMLPIGLSSIFLCLFLLGNPVLVLWYKELLVIIEEPFHFLVEKVSFLRIVLWCSIFAIAWALIRSRLRTFSSNFLKVWNETSAVQNIQEREMLLRCLVLFNLLFALQTLLDIGYLWCGAALPDGMSYAEYAHRGAYPLVATAILAGLFVLTALRPESEASADPLVCQLVYAWIFQNILLLLSSIFRLFLYIEAYSLTRWRVAALIWMGLVCRGIGEHMCSHSLL